LALLVRRRRAAGAKKRKAPPALTDGARETRVSSALVGAALHGYDDYDDAGALNHRRSI